MKKTGRVLITGMVALGIALFAAPTGALAQKSKDKAPATPPPATAPAGEPTTTPGPRVESTQVFTVSTVAVSAPSGQIVTTDDLLSALEHTGKDIRTLQADLRWTKEFGEITGGDEKHTREGTLAFESIAADTALSKPVRRFQVDFLSEIIDNVRHEKPVTYVFDGQWFVERQHKEKQVIRRQVVPPGEVVDPLAIGEGPFPVPIGQQKSKILERFSAELLPAGDDFPGGTAPESLKETYQLKLTPLPGTHESKQFRSVRIWYRTSDLLPRLARTTDRDDSKTEVFLTNLRINEALRAGAFDISRPDGWGGDDQNFRRANADQ